MILGILCWIKALQLYRLIVTPVSNTRLQCAYSLRLYIHVGGAEGQVADPMDPGSPSKYGVLEKDLKVSVGVSSFWENPGFAWNLSLTGNIISLICAQLSHPFCQCTPVNIHGFMYVSPLGIT